MLSHLVVSDSLHPWTAAHQAPLFMGIFQARILEWVAIPSSRGSSQPRDRAQVSHIAGWFFTIWATRETHVYMDIYIYNGILLLLFSRSVRSDSLWSPGLQHSRLPSPHHLPEFAQTHVNRVSHAIQLFHPLSSPSPLALNLSQHQGLFLLPTSKIWEHRGPERPGNKRSRTRTQVQVQGPKGSPLCASLVRSTAKTMFSSRF